MSKRPKVLEREEKITYHTIILGFGVGQLPSSLFIRFPIFVEDLVNHDIDPVESNIDAPAVFRHGIVENCLTQVASTAINELIPLRKEEY